MQTAVGFPVLNRALFSQYSDGLLGPEKLVRYSLMAGELALSAYGHEDAWAHFQRGLTAGGVPSEASEPAQEAEAAALLYGLGRAQAAILPRDRVGEAVESLNRALAYYCDVGDVDSVVLVAEYPFYPLIGQRTGNDQLISRALALVPAESPSAARLLSRYGRLVGLEEGDYDRAQDTFTRALAIAHREADLSLEMRILADAGNVDLLHCQFQESLEKCMRAVGLASPASDPYVEVLARYTAVLDQISIGNLEGARVQALAVLAPAERLRDRFWLSMAYRAQEDIAHLAGDWDTARELSDRGLEQSVAEPRSLCTRAVLEHQIGDFIQGEYYLTQLIEVMKQTPPGPALPYSFTAMTVPILARVTGEPVRIDLVESGASAVLSSPVATAFHAQNARIAMALLSANRGDTVSVQELYVALKPCRHRMILFVMVAGDRVLGLLSVAIGEIDQGLAHFQDALAFCRESGYRPELAWTCCDYADTLLQRNEPGDREKAMSLLDESLAISNLLGMRPLMERVLSRRDILRA